VYTEPKEGEYQVETIVAFGTDVDLSSAAPGFTLPTEDFPVE
jgi:hypothetical protein